MNLRWLKKADGTMVLEECIYKAPPERKDHLDFWKAVPTVEEPKPKKELEQVLFETFQESFGGTISWEAASIKLKNGSKAQAKAAREYLENERKESGK